MSEQDNEELDSTNQTTEEVVNTEEVEETPVQEESEDLEALKEQNKKLFERAKTAEAKLKELKPKEAPPKVEPPPQGSNLSPGDIVALSKINEEDIDEVIALASFKKKPVKELLKDSYTQAWIKIREEERKTAAATSTGATKRPTSKTTDDALLERAQTTGEIPDNKADLDRLVAAKFKARMKEKLQ